MLIPTFKDSALEEELNEKGFIVISNFLPKESVDTLMSLHNAYHIEREKAFWNSHNDLPLVSGVEISNHIKTLMEPALDKLFNNWLFPFAQFIVLNPSSDHHFHFSVHRDPSIFDEKKVQYRNLWMPLVNLTPQNGALYMVPKSHKLFTDTQPSFIKWPYDHLVSSLEAQYDTIYAKAGDLIIWMEKTLHGSYENLSDESRPAIQGGVIHKEAKPLFYRYVVERDEVDTYQVDTSFFLNKEYLDPTAFGKYPLLETKKYTFKEVTEADVHAFFN